MTDPNPAYLCEVVRHHLLLHDELHEVEFTVLTLAEPLPWSIVGGDQVVPVDFPGAPRLRCVSDDELGGDGGSEQVQPERGFRFRP